MEGDDRGDVDAVDALEKRVEEEAEGIEGHCFR